MLVQLSQLAKPSPLCSAPFGAGIYSHIDNQEVEGANSKSLILAQGERWRRA